MQNRPDRVDRTFPRHLAGVIRWNDAEQAYRAVLTAARSKLGSVEITSGTPSAFELIRRLKAEVGEACVVGAGTITDAKLAEKAVSSGAQYLVTPYLCPEAAAVAKGAGVLLVMGATTPTEIAQAMALGADLVKVFPAGPIGGPAYLEAVRGPMPDVPLWVSGGVGLADIGAYLRVGARVIGLTGDLFSPELLRNGDLDEIERRCRRALREAGVEERVAAG